MVYKLDVKDRQIRYCFQCDGLFFPLMWIGVPSETIIWQYVSINPMEMGKKWESALALFFPHLQQMHHAC